MQIEGNSRPTTEDVVTSWSDKQQGWSKGALKSRLGEIRTSYIKKDLLDPRKLIKNFPAVRFLLLGRGSSEQEELNAQKIEALTPVIEQILDVPEFFFPAPFSVTLAREILSDCAKQGVDSAGIVLTGSTANGGWWLRTALGTENLADFDYGQLSNPSKMSDAGAVARIGVDVQKRYKDAGYRLKLQTVSTDTNPETLTAPRLQGVEEAVAYLRTLPGSLQDDRDFNTKRLAYLFPLVTENGLDDSQRELVLLGLEEIRTQNESEYAELLDLLVEKLGDCLTLKFKYLSQAEPTSSKSDVKRLEFQQAYAARTKEKIRQFLTRENKTAVRLPLIQRS